MEIAVSSTSFPDDLARYVGNRLVTWRIVPLWLVLAAFAAGVSRAPTALSILAGALLAALLMVQFRLWDDLADRHHDALLHPERVLVLTTHLRRFGQVCAMLALPIVALLAVAFSATHVLVYGLLVAAMAVVYAVPHAAMPRLLRSHLVLLKYPVFIGLCAHFPDTALMLRVGATLFILMSVIDSGSEPAPARGPARMLIWVIETVTLVALWLL
jgi:4-hydroxybenzoate polyprenyltransferase